MRDFPRVLFLNYSNDVNCKRYIYIYLFIYENCIKSYYIAILRLSFEKSSNAVYYNIGRRGTFLFINERNPEENSF